MNSIQTYRNI